MKLEPGKSYKIVDPNSSTLKPVKIHVDYVLDNPVYKNDESKLIVYRVYSYKKQRWFNYCEPFYRFVIYNQLK